MKQENLVKVHLASLKYLLHHKLKDLKEAQEVCAVHSRYAQQLRDEIAKAKAEIKLEGSKDA